MEITQREWDAALEERHTPAVARKLKNASVAVAGLGGLGSAIAVALTRCGVGRLLIADFDKVELSNLNRQQYFPHQIGMPKTEALREILLAINPFLKIEQANGYIDESNAAEIFGGYPIVCEAFDRAENKAMLVNTLLEQTDAVIISASGMGGFLSSNTITTKKFGGRLYVCGDMETDSASVNGLMAPRVGICACHQANMAVRLICGETEV